MWFKRLPLASIKQPCGAAWDAMVGTDRARHCGECDRTIYNLSAMKTSEAERLLAGCAGERLCVTFARGPDGGIITADRPARFGRGGLGLASTAAAALTVSVAVTVAAGQQAQAPKGGLRGTIRAYQTDDLVGEATITAVDQKTGDAFRTKSHEDGTYQLPLSKGRYDVTISYPHSWTCVVDGVDIGGRMVTADANLDFQLNVGEVVITHPDPAPGCNNKKLNRLVHKK